MRITIHKSEISGTTVAPASKSYTIRSLMCAALARGRSEISNPLSSDDTVAALRVLEQIGVDIEKAGDSWYVDGGYFKAPSAEMFCGDSAATLRFMSAIGALVPGKSCLTAGLSLAKRPIITLVDALKQWGVDISCRNDTSPVIINGGRLRGGLTQLPGDISSQYVSALLLIAPLAEIPAMIRLTTPLESKPYVLMTLECMRQFGIEIPGSDELMYYETSQKSYRPVRYQVEGDWSSAAYLLGLGAVAGELKVSNLNLQSLQGDKSILAFLTDMGVSIETPKDSIKVKRLNLKAITADLSDCIDLLPTMAVLASMAEGTSVFSGIKRARLKESNRILAVKEGLTRAGIKVEAEADKLTVRGGKPQKAIINAYHDHRIAMAFSLLGAAAGGITIEGAESVSKTYPDYWHILRNLGVKIDEQ